MRRPKGMGTFARKLILQCKANPPEPDNLRHVLFYRNLAAIQQWLRAQGIEVQEYDRTHKKPFSVAFYQTLSSTLSKMVLDGELSYADLHITEEERIKDEAEAPEHKVGLMFEKQGLYNTFKPIKAGLNISLWSCKGFQSTNVLEQITARLRRDPLKTLFIVSDFDPSGVEIAEDLERRARKLGIRTKFVRIAINPEDIPAERRSMSLVQIKERDSRARKFIRRFGRQAFEVEALSTRELRELVLRRILEHGIDLSISVAARHQENQRWISRLITERLLLTLKNSIRRVALQKIQAYDTRRPTAEQLRASIVEATDFLGEPREMQMRIATELRAQFGITDEDDEA